MFGREMTAVAGACRHCGAVAQIAELRVYSRAPGAVVRCRRCGQVVFVVVVIREEPRIYLDQFALEWPTGSPSHSLTLLGRCLRLLITMLRVS